MAQAVEPLAKKEEIYVLSNYSGEVFYAINHKGKWQGPS